MKWTKYIVLAAMAVLCFSCSDDDESALKNDLIKKTTAPAIAGEKVEFAYAMGTVNGKLAKAEAVASISGATGTNFELYSWFTARYDMTVGGVLYRAGNDVPLRTVRDVSTDGNVSTATMEDKIDEIYVNPAVAPETNWVDMIAATLRYVWVVPEEAKGKSVSFTFSAYSSTGEKVSYQTPAYTVSKIDMERLIPMTSGDVCYFSIENMAAYTRDEVTAQNLAGKIDFIYIYQAKLGLYDYKHSFVSPATDPKYIAVAGVVPAGSTNRTLMEKRVNVRDAQLKGSIPNVYIDDIDFQTLKLEDAVDYALGFITDDGAFMKTGDGKYAAYVYINNVNDGAATATVSIKRYPLQ
jgi:hypothetical protein